jgi:hypothetical protein
MPRLTRTADSEKAVTPPNRFIFYSTMGMERQPTAERQRAVSSAFFYASGWAASGILEAIPPPVGFAKRRPTVVWKALCLDGLVETFSGHRVTYL